MRKRQAMSNSHNLKIHESEIFKKTPDLGCFGHHELLGVDSFAGNGGFCLVFVVYERN